MTHNPGDDECPCDKCTVQCFVCMDTGETGVGDLLLPCPCCDLAEWNTYTELADEARQGR